MRSRGSPSGLPDIPPCKWEKVRLGNALAEAMVVLASAHARTGRRVQVEQPSRSLMMVYPPVEAIVKEFGFVAYQRDACVDGAPGANHY